MPKRILIAEDDFASREALTKLATRNGYEVVAVADGVELLAIANISRFDLVITDLTMPSLNGASATEIMILQGSTTPVIALTGHNPQDISLVQDKFIRVFHKPIDVNELFGYVKSLLGK